jgi:hypothetical protein
MYTRLEAVTHIGLKFYVVLSRDVEKLNIMEKEFRVLGETDGEKFQNVLIGEINVVKFNVFHRCQVLDKNYLKKKNQNSAFRLW